MEKLLLFFLMTVISIILGIVGKKISFFERKIYREIFYFPLIITITTILSFIFIFLNLKMSLLFFSISLIAITWYL